MARRPDPQRIVTSRREAQLARLRGGGFSGERALAEVKRAEGWARAHGMDPTERRYWDAVRSILDEAAGSID